jgi:hypothetical protein
VVQLRGGVLDSCFKLPFEFAVPDVLYAREMTEFVLPNTCLPTAIF